MENIDYEREKLKETLKKYKEIMEFYKLKLDSLPRMYGNNPDVLESMLKLYENKLKVMNKTSENPYFARIDFQGKSKKNIEKFYIGKIGVDDEDNKNLIIDWRAPIASVYYDSNIGPISYEAPGGTYDGELHKKRQFEIKNKELINYQDVDTVSNDELLKPYLGTNSDARLKNIVTTIQSEQNKIIREKIYKNMIVQGVAGSGKTTVALHRIAYLVYNNLDNIKPEQYVVIGPNKFFINYISSVLPDLDVNNVYQLTFDEMCNNFLDSNYDYLESDEKLVKSIKNSKQLNYENFKCSMNFKKFIDNYFESYIENFIPKKDLTIKGYTILPREIISKIFYGIKSDVVNYEVISKKVDRAQLLIAKYIDENYESILSRVQNDIYQNINSTESHKDEHKNRVLIEKQLRNGCKQATKSYFNIAKIKLEKLYIDFLNDFNKKVDVDFSKEIKTNINNFKNNIVEFEDLAPLMYFKYKLFGNENYADFKHVVIDEAQDLGEFSFYVLKLVMPNSTFSIFGDLAQSIYEFRGINSWEIISSEIFEEHCEIKYLNKSYRTTVEIMENANLITDYIGLNQAEPVIRHGIDVEYSKINGDNIELIKNKISKYLSLGYETIAVICKDEEETNFITEQLENDNIVINKINSSNVEYKGGICVITSHLAKGLEFDSVIISNASSKIYDNNKNVDMKLLYVAMTRPLHELTVLYDDEIVEPLNKAVVKYLTKYHL